MRAVLAALAVMWAFGASAAAQQAPANPNIRAELHSVSAAVAPGDRFTILLTQHIRDGWHTYWRNPGVSGEPMHLAWTTPGFAVSEPQWPAPSVLLLGPLVSYGYSHEVTFPIEVTAPRNARVGTTATLRANATWLVCSDQICVPEQATLVLNVPIVAQGMIDPQQARSASQATNTLPAASQAEARITAGEPAHLSIGLRENGRAIATESRNFYFFPYDRDAVHAGGAQHPRAGAGGVSLVLTAGVDGPLGQAPLSGVLTYEEPAYGDVGGVTWMRRAIEVNASPGAALAETDEQGAKFSSDNPVGVLEGAETAAVAAPEMSVLVAALFAFLGGLILNLMPCVLPVLAVKALSLTDSTQRGAARRHGALYFAGCLATFVALALVLVTLRAGGDAVGWGFQLQSPLVTSLLALLFFAIGLNLLGVFHLGGSVQNTGAGAAARGGDAGAFFTGALAVVAATPCTAPFMAGAIGAALTQSAGATLAIFAALGAGFALPLTAIHFLPGLQRLMPKPGVWMERVRNVLAFPMFAAATWLAWVLTQQAGANGALALLLLTVALAFALMAARWGKAWLVAGLIVLACAAAFTWRPLLGAETASALRAEPWSTVRVTQARSEGHGVFVNFTAAWCITCQANEISVLSRPEIAEAFARRRVVYLKADWTNGDAAIAAELAAHGRAGVPLYLYYPPGNTAPIVLPQILSEAAINEAIAGVR